MGWSILLELSTRLLGHKESLCINKRACSWPLLNCNMVRSDGPEGEAIKNSIDMISWWPLFPFLQSFLCSFMWFSHPPCLSDVRLLTATRNAIHNWCHCWTRMQPPPPTNLGEETSLIDRASRWMELLVKEVLHIYSHWGPVFQQGCRPRANWSPLYM